MSSTAFCRSCGVSILWVVVNNRLMPIDSDPSPAGMIEAHAIPGDTSRRLVGRVVSAAERGGRMLYTSHFATCADANKWRRKK
jgi:hypothetical protein